MYQIESSFTRLQPAIDFSMVEIDHGTTNTTVIGKLPQQFASVHCPSLLNAWHERLTQAMAEPTQTERCKGHRRVQVLGNAIFDFDERGVVHAYRWIFNEFDLPALVQMPDQTVVAEGVPYQSLWLNGYTAGFLRSLQALYPGKPELCQSYAEWVSSGLASLIWTDQNQATVRAQIAHDLGLESQILTITRQIQVTEIQHRPIRLQEYNYVILDRMRYQWLLQESPKLVPLYALLASEMEQTCEITDQMKQRLASFRIGPAMWRLLFREGTAWINDFLAYFDFNLQSRGMAAIEILSMTQAFGTSALPPSILLHALMQLGGNPNGPSANFVERLNDLFPLCKRLGHLIDKASAKDMDLLQDQAHAILNWASDHLQSVPRSTLRRASLQWLVRAVKAQALLDEKALKGAHIWSVPYQIKLVNTDVSAVILDNPLAVWQEGKTMRHCADKYAGRCASGDLIMVSLRGQQHRHPLATVTFGVGKGSVSVHKFSGFANERVSSEVQDLINQCHRQLVVQRRGLAANQASVRVAA